MAIIDNLFEDTEPATNSIDERECKINPVALQRLLPTAQQNGSEPVALCFNLFAGVDVILHTQHIQPIEQGGFSWSGQFPGVMDIYGHLSVSWPDSAHLTDCVVAGSVTTGPITYGILPAGVGYVRIIRLPAAAIAHDDVVYDLANTQDSGTPGTSHRANIVETPEFAAEDNAPEFALIDILVIYAKDVLAEIPAGLRAIHTHVDLAAVMANATFQFSKIPARVRIIGVEGAALKNGRSVSLLLYEVIGRPAAPTIGRPAVEPDAASAAEVNALREQYQADVVALVVPEMLSDGVAGIAGCIPEPPDTRYAGLIQSIFAVCLDCIIDNTFVHELGHLLGSKHDRVTQPTRAGIGLPMYDYVRGYTRDERRSLVTVMGYAGSSGVRVPAFSSSDADITWNSEPLGVPVTQENAADEAVFLRKSVYTVADYRGSIDEQIRYQLDLAVEPPEAGTVLPQMLGPYLKGSVVTVSAFQRAGGYRFSHWKLGRHFHGATAVTTVVMNQPNTLTAVFDDSDALCNLFTSVEPANAATIIVTPPGNRFDVSAEVALSLQPVPGASYAFVGWYKDSQTSGSIQIPFNLKIDRDTHVTAKFAEGKYQVTVKAVPADAGIVVPQNGFDRLLVLAGEPFWEQEKHISFLINAYARNDYWVAYWLANGSNRPRSELNNATISGWQISENVQIEAHFQGGPGALHLTSARSEPADAAAVQIVLAEDPRLQSLADWMRARAQVSPENYRFIAGTLLRASFSQTEEQTKYHFQGWRIDSSPLEKANVGNSDYQWKISKTCEIVAVFT